MQIRPAVKADLDVIARVQARTMVAADYYDDSVDEELEFQRLRRGQCPRIARDFCIFWRHSKCTIATMLR